MTRTLKSLILGAAILTSGACSPEREPIVAEPNTVVAVSPASDTDTPVVVADAPAALPEIVYYQIGPQ